MLTLTESDVAALLSMPEAIDLLDEAFQAWARGEADNVPRRRAKGSGLILHSMCAAADYLGLAGYKNYTTTRSGAQFQVGLYDLATGDLIALIQADKLGQIRTGAATGLACRYLAPEGVKTVGIYGTGWQAESQVAAVASELSPQQILVYGRDEQRRNAFCEKMTDQLETDVLPVSDATAPARQAVVVTATTSQTPVFSGDLLQPGTLVIPMGSNWLNKAEVDPTAVGRASRVICDSIEACRIEAGDLDQAAAAGTWSWDTALELRDIIAAGPQPTADNAITLFKSVGLALEDLAVGNFVLQQAKVRGRGQHIDLFAH